MPILELQIIDFAPESSKHSIAEVMYRYGRIPKLDGTLANSSILLNGYMALNHQFERSSLSAAEAMKMMSNYSDHIFPIPIYKYCPDEY